MTKDKIKTASQLRAFVEASGNCPYFFTRDPMKFFGDTMRNYGVAGPYEAERLSGGKVMVYELYRRRPVKDNNQESAYFDAETFKKVCIKK